MSIKFLPKIEVPRVESISLWEFFTFLKDSIDKVIDAFTQNEVSWKRPNLLNSWQNYGIPYQEASYRKDGSGMVWLSGVIKDGTPGVASTALLLPVGYRPAVTLRFSVASDDAANPAHAEITRDGAVIIEDGSTTLTSLDGIVFRVE